MDFRVLDKGQSVLMRSTGRGEASRWRNAQTLQVSAQGVTVFGRITSVHGLRIIPSGGIRNVQRVSLHFDFDFDFAM